VIKYIGSKRRLLPHITQTICSLPGVRTVADLFSGTSRVGHALKAAGLYVKANDHAAYAACLARCHVAADRDAIQSRAERLIAELRRTPPSPGYFTHTFCERSRFFHPANGARIDSIRERIAGLELDDHLEAVALTSLMEAADRVDSTTGVQMAYLKQWAPRALKELDLQLPSLLPGPGEAHRLDAADAASLLTADLAYLDPPYNQHSYARNYHIWETLVLWDKPAVYGVACKREDCRTSSSDFNSRTKAVGALRRVLDACEADYLLVSFNDEGHVDRTTMESLLSRLGSVSVTTIPGRRYVGAQIGIYNPQGEKVGTVGRLHNNEYLYLVRRST